MSDIQSGAVRDMWMFDRGGPQHVPLCVEFEGRPCICLFENESQAKQSGDAMRTTGVPIAVNSEIGEAVYIKAMKHKNGVVVVRDGKVGRIVGMVTPE